MQKSFPSISSRTEEFTPRDLPLRQPTDPPRRAFLPEPRPGSRLRDALLRWLEEEM